MNIENIANADNSCTEPEIEAEPLCEEDNNGELQNYLKFTVWRDTGVMISDQLVGYCDNELQEGEQVIYSEKTVRNKIIPIADKSTGNPLPGETTYCIGISWDLPYDTGNIVQSDSVSGDVSFTAVQSKNNDDFYCIPR